MMSERSNKSLAAGLLFAAAGAFFAINAYLKLDMGQVSAIGPGFFPMMLGVILILLGCAIALQVVKSNGTPFGTVSLRAVLCIGLAPLLFALMIQGLGLIASVALTTVVACFSSRLMTLRISAVVVVTVTLVSVLIFHYLIALPVPLVGRWLTFGAA